MSRNVFILGAGASREAGAPLMGDFLDTAKQLWRGGKVNDSAEHFERVFRAIGSLQRVHSKSQLDINNVESVFAAFEMAALLGMFSDYPPDSVQQLAPSMRILIARTIEETLRFPVSNGYRQAPPPYGSLAELIVYLRQEAFPNQRAAILTFNYDLAADFALHDRYGIDYGLTPPKDQQAVPLLKLHGSLNWFYCSTCKAIIPWQVSDYIAKYQLLPLISEVTVSFRSRVREWDHVARLGHDVEAEPFLVPPTWNKGEYHRTLAPVWARAAKELQDAENIFVVGYSLPPTDEFFRYLYSLGTLGDVTLERFWVLNPDPALQDRFRALLGPAAEQRFKYFSYPFTTGLPYIRSAFPAEKR